MSSNQTQPLVTILIPTRNRPEELRLTLRSLKQQTYTPVEVIVIDDASDEGLSSVVEQEWPGAVFRRNEKHLGLLANRSFGMNKAKGEYILSLDDDSSLTDPRDLARAVERMACEPELGILTFFVHHGPELPKLTRSHLDERYVHTFIGCGHMIRTQVVEALGGYLDFWFYGPEESEYSLRVLDAGWRILFFPSVVVHHRVSPIGRSDSRLWGYSLRNNLWMLLLHMPWERVLMEGGWKLFVNGIEAIRRLEFRWGIWALLSFVGGLPRVLRLRKPISRETLRRYDALRFRIIRTPETYETAQPPALQEIWNWFHETWWHRRRAHPFWNRGPGGVGRSATASFSDGPSGAEGRPSHTP